MIELERLGGFIRFNLSNISWRKYDVEGFREELKELVPAEERDYDDFTSDWWIDEKYECQVNELIHRYFSR